MREDNNLGQKIRCLLQQHSLENDILEKNIALWQNLDYESKLTQKLAEFLTMLGLNITNKNLADTPSRVLKHCMQNLFYGLDYANFPEVSTMPNQIEYNTPIVLRKITVNSVCEHHLTAIRGVARVAYIPKDKIIGLGHVNQIVHFFAARPQLQERLTNQISIVLQEILATEDVAVMIDAIHDCMVLREVDSHGTEVSTCKMSGQFLLNNELRKSFGL